jgi:uncharacterized membrane protein YccC
MPRFRVRTLMISVAVVALLLGSIGPGKRGYRRWSYYRSQVAMYSQLEMRERLNRERELINAADRTAIKFRLINSQGLAGKSPQDVDRAIDRVVAFHKQQAAQALDAADRWGRNKRDSRTAAMWCWDPFAPDVP